MKALSFWNPYGALVGLAKKQWETRCWSTRLRGTIAIHTTKTIPKECRPLFALDSFKEALASELVTNGEEEFYHLPCSAIIAVADITEVITTRQWLDRFEGNPRMRAEFEFGDYSAGRFAWKLENVRRLQEPIPCKGWQRLWSVSREIKLEIERRLAA